MVTNLVKRGATRDLAVARIDVRVAGMAEAAAALESLAALAAGLDHGPNPNPDHPPTQALSPTEPQLLPLP